METALLKTFTLIALMSCVACSPKDKKYETVMQVVSSKVVEREADGGAAIVDVELEYDPCPGDQVQVVRGGGEFARCAEKLAAGDYLTAHIVYHWDERGYFTWDAAKIGECDHEIDWESEGSYEKSQECNDIEVYGRKLGFKCSRRPFKKLVETCPFLKRR